MPTNTALVLRGGVPVQLRQHSDDNAGIVTV